MSDHIFDFTDIKTALPNLRLITSLPDDIRPITSSADVCIAAASLITSSYCCICKTIEPVNCTSIVE